MMRDQPERHCPCQKLDPNVLVVQTTKVGDRIDGAA